MPSSISHVAVPITIASVAGKRNVPKALLKAGMAAAVIPDLDLVGLVFGIPFEHPIGHRGFFHSPVFGLLLALVSLGAWRKLGPSRSLVFGVVFLSILSHSMLDAATYGSVGVAFLSPFSNERFLLPWRPIPVVPMALTSLFGLGGLAMVVAEVVWIWMPCLAVIGFFRLLRKLQASSNKRLEGTTTTKSRFFNPTLDWERWEANRKRA